jgi:hypothetical protein
MKPQYPNYARQWFCFLALTSAAACQKSPNATVKTQAPCNLRRRSCVWRRNHLRPAQQRTAHRIEDQRINTWRDVIPEQLDTLLFAVRGEPARESTAALAKRVEKRYEFGEWARGFHSRHENQRVTCRCES